MDMSALALSRPSAPATSGPTPTLPATHTPQRQPRGCTRRTPAHARCSTLPHAHASAVALPGEPGAALGARRAALCRRRAAQARLTPSECQRAAGAPPFPRAARPRVRLDALPPQARPDEERQVPGGGGPALRRRCAPRRRRRSPTRTSRPHVLAAAAHRATQRREPPYDEPAGVRARAQPVPGCPLCSAALARRPAAAGLGRAHGRRRTRASAAAGPGGGARPGARARRAGGTRGPWLARGLAAAAMRGCRTLLSCGWRRWPAYSIPGSAAARASQPAAGAVGAEGLHEAAAPMHRPNLEACVDPRRGRGGGGGPSPPGAAPPRAPGTRPRRCCHTTRRRACRRTDAPPRIRSPLPRSAP